MKTTSTGWVVITDNHGRLGNTYIADYSFSSIRSEAIKKFIKGSTRKWPYWKRRYGYKCVKATMTLEIDNSQ